MFKNILVNIITETFTKDPGKNQTPAFRKAEKEPRAFLMTFNTRTNHEVEEGYRYLDMIIYGPMNYVQVWTRRRSNVIALADMEDDGDGEMVPKRGKDYTQSATTWEMHADHDSCWRDGVDRILRENEMDITGIEYIFKGWYQVIPVPPELEELYQKERDRRLGR